MSGGSVYHDDRLPVLFQFNFAVGQVHEHRRIVGRGLQNHGQHPVRFFVELKLKQNTGKTVGGMYVRAIASQRLFVEPPGKLKTFIALLTDVSIIRLHAPPCDLLPLLICRLANRVRPLNGSCPEQYACRYHSGRNV